MQNFEIQQIKHLVQTALYFVKYYGQNGALSAGNGSFDSLCSAIALRTGKPFEAVAQVTAPIWEEFWEFRTMQGLDVWPDNWHVWEF